ncbi:uncharacterized protein LAJ45_06945 [Morchella importuna]|uniref:uncharacterized protein n=1 Tax=Morchella importuna TaxID=1174673 RepID=UPI001E8CBB88|nr:uncharacterized protein LAJ45_06945 [Morchella importuna]KAH8148970.1 hypothetical protein LAJ45_06945 [Morchella importuna]
MAEAIGVAASIAGLVQVIATVYGLIHTYAGGVNRADKDRQELLEELKTLSLLVVHLQDEVRENWEGSPALQALCSRDGVLQGCALECAVELKRLEDRFKHKNRFLSRLKWPLQAGETKEYVEKIERFKSTVDIALGLDNRASMRRLEENVKSATLLVQDFRAETKSMMNLATQNSEPSQADASSRKAILDWLYPGDFNAKHYEIGNRRQKGTGDWLLKSPEFIGWVEGRLKSRLLWGHGIPGAGKTFLSSTVIDHLGNTSSTKRGFLLVHLHINYLCQQTTTNQILNALEKLESTAMGETSLYPTYDSAIERINGQHPPERELAIKILTWLVKARRVLAMNEIREAVSIVPNRYEMDEMDLPERRTLIEEYLLEKASLILKPDAELAIACVTYLSFDAFSVELPDNYTLGMKRVKRRLIHQYPFVTYSSEMAIFHMRSSDMESTFEPFLHFLGKTHNMSLFVRMGNHTFLYPSPLHIASAAGHLEVVKRLVEKGEDVLVADPLSRLPLHIAALEGREAVVSYFLRTKHRRQHWVATIKGYHGNTALHEASSGGHERVVMLLLNKHLYPPWIRKIHKLVNMYQNTALYCAVSNGHEAVARLLLDNGADINAAYEQKGILLHMAAEMGHEAIVKLLLDNGADVNAIYELKQTLLHKAVEMGREAIVKLLLDRGADVSAVDQSNKTALHKAARDGKESMVKLLLEKGADIDAINQSNETALHRAAWFGAQTVHVAKLLLEKGADINAVNQSNETALHKAARDGNEAMVKLLLEKGADVNAVDQSNKTALHKAARDGKEAMVKLLLEKGADVNAVDQSNETALHKAARDGNEAMVKLLLEKGADVNAVDQSNKTALHKAARYGNEAVVKLLLEKGADVNAVDQSNETALHKAAWFGRQAVVELLLEKGADVNAVDQSNETALHKAAWFGTQTVHITALHKAARDGKEAMVKLLLEKGADIDAVNQSNETALHRAAWFGAQTVHVAKLLLEKGADINAVNQSNETALHKAAWFGRQAVVELLLEKGADVNAVDQSNETALHKAAWFGTQTVHITALHKAARDGKEAMVKLLSEKGADVNAVDQSNETALHKAARDGNEAMVKLLLEKGADVNAVDQSNETALHRVAKASVLEDKIPSLELIIIAAHTSIIRLAILV